jgi:hypothetical protein
MRAAGRDMTTPDESKVFDKGRIDSVTFGSVTINRNTYEPGWRWSECVGSLSNSDTCWTHHIGYVVSGTLRVRTEEGIEAEIGAGHAYEILPGHDGWVIGDELMIAVEFAQRS